MLHTTAIDYKTSPKNMGKFDFVGKTELILEALKELGINKAIAVPTCNRTEILYDSDEKLHKDIISKLCKLKNLDQNNNYGFVHFSGNNSIKRLLEVYVGVHSRKIGETQIAGQFETAVNTAKNNGMDVEVFKPLIDLAHKTQAQVSSKTRFHDGMQEDEFIAYIMASSLPFAGHKSFSGVTREFIDELHNLPVEEREYILENSTKKPGKLLIVGTSHLAYDVLSRTIEVTYYGNNRQELIAISSPNAERVEAKAAPLGIKNLDYKNLGETSKGFDTIVLAVSAMNEKDGITQVIKEENAGLFKNKKIYDLCEPAAIAGDARKILQDNGCVIHDLASIQQQIGNATTQRLDELTKVNAIIRQNIVKYWKAKPTPEVCTSCATAKTVCFNKTAMAV